MFEYLRKYLKKAGEEASKEYAIKPCRSDGTRQKNPDKNSIPWIGVDLDGTLAIYKANTAIDTIGDPVPAMLSRVKEIIQKGTRIKIFTARAGDPEQLPLIRKWLKTHNLPELEITNVKDYHMIRLYDDRCIQVEKNTGRLIVETSKKD